MSEIQLTVPKLHARQREIVANAARFNVLCCGRRFGKDVLAQDLILDAAIAGRPVAWFTPTFRMMLDTFRDVSRTARELAVKVNASDHRIELITGGVIDFWSLDAPDVARGRRYSRVVVNEAAMVKGLLDSWQRIIRPTLADLSGDAWFLSTPRGYNDFHTLYARATEGGDWRAWRYPTWDNPHIKRSEIDAMRGEMDAASFRQEIGAEFQSVVGLVYPEFTEDNITSDEPDLTQPIELGFDDGYIDPRAVVFVQRTPTRIHVFDELYQTKTLDETTVCTILERMAALYALTLPAEWGTWRNAERSAWLVGNGGRLPALAVGSSEAVQLMRRFREANITARGGTHEVVEGVKLVRRLVLDGNGVRSLHVHRRCGNLIREITREYVYPDGARRDNEKPADGNDHAADALRYYVHMRGRR